MTPALKFYMSSAWHAHEIFHVCETVYKTRHKKGDIKRTNICKQSLDIDIEYKNLNFQQHKFYTIKKFTNFMHFLWWIVVNLKFRLRKWNMVSDFAILAQKWCEIPAQKQKFIFGSQMPWLCCTKGHHASWRKWTKRNAALCTTSRVRVRGCGCGQA